MSKKEEILFDVRGHFEQSGFEIMGVNCILFNLTLEGIRCLNTKVCTYVG